MNSSSPAPGPTAHGSAVRELQVLHAQIDQARRELSTLVDAITSLCDRHAAPQADLLAATNTSLVVALLDARAETATVVQTLDRVARSADHDDLTGLPCRSLLLDRMGQAMAQARRVGTYVGVLFVDLDNFKLINDTKGHAAGDRVLRQVAVALTAALREADTVSRHGGDEFLVLLPDMASVADAALAADRIHAALRAMDVDVSVAGSIGISVFPDDGEDPAQLIERADRAMYRAKQTSALGGPHGSAFHPAPWRSETARTPDPDVQAQLREAIAHLLQAALDAQQLQAAAEAARRQLADFMAVLSHELRNPLAPIRNAAALLDRVGPDELPRLQALIERQVLRLQRLTGDLVDIARVDVGKLRLHMVRLELSNILAESIEVARAGIDARQQTFEIDVAPSLCINGDSIRLEQVFANLLDNASKYTPRGGRVGVHASACPDTTDTLQVIVSDSGIGISSTALGHVFDAFVQDPDAVAFDSSGMGIGLAVVRDLVTAHGGSISAASAGTGHGSQFSITLPRVA